ncbi:MAG: hypothetical protein M3Y56_01920 [Armatimonadota bacterium]|nr:hypothetical protein [Armatimonadota bacterium]
MPLSAGCLVTRAAGMGGMRLGTYDIARGHFEPLLMDCSANEGWELVGSLVPQTFHLCIYRLRNQITEEYPRYRVRVCFERNVVDEIDCSSLSDLLRLLSTLTPLAYLGAAERKERIQELHLQVPEDLN